ncbi:MAG: amino acid permease, partial [Candidatus Glassbacteria bacterium]|nr:amino acid permease [Candidatus Glassbacteria bacterium]
MAIGRNPVRRIGIAAAASLVVSNMVGAGIFTTSGFLIESLRSPGLLLAVWAAGGALALAGATAYGELGASLPRVGGDYVFIREAYGPLWAFLSGWMAFFAGIGAPISLTALAFVEHLTPYFPGLSIQGREPLFTLFGLTPTISPGHLAAIGTIWLLTLVHYLGIRVSGRVQVSLTVLNLLLIISFIFLAFFSKAGDWGSFSPAPLQQAPSGWEIFPVFAVALVLVLYSYSGFNAAAYVGGEIEKPGKNLPRGIFTGTAVVVLLYLALNAVYIYALPPEKMAGRLDVAKLAALDLIGPAWGSVFSLVIALAVLACTSAMVCIG